MTRGGNSLCTRVGSGFSEGLPLTNEIGIRLGRLESRLTMNANECVCDTSTGGRVCTSRYREEGRGLESKLRVETDVATHHVSDVQPDCAQPKGGQQRCFTVIQPIDNALLAGVAL